MVLLSYQTEGNDRESGSTKKDKDESPKTPYIEKLYTFNAARLADEARCDLFFICKDGEIPAHRLVISNASNYIRGMQTEQPAWHNVYISVPDFTTEIVNTLVCLAYTGEMNIPPGTTSDELLDAIQTLGWVNTDCLTSTYLDSSGASADDDFGFSVSNKTESVETVLKRNFPAKVENEASDDDDEMELALPDVPMSDEEGRLEIDLSSPKKKVLPTKRTRQTKPPKKPTPSKSKLETPSKRGQPSKKVDTNEPPEASPIARKSSRKNNGDAVTSSPPKDIPPEVPTNSVEIDSGPLRSRTRTIRKPKKFDDLIVLTPTKRKDSPIKSPTKSAAKNTKVADSASGKPAAEPTKAAAKPTGTKKTTNDVQSVSVANKNRRSISTDSKDSTRNSLITSYFNKKSPRKSNDAMSAEETTEDDKEVGVGKNVQNSTNNSNEPSKTDGLDNTGDSTVEPKGNVTSTRNRARSTASSKSDKEIPQDTSNADADAVKTRRKRSIQEPEESVEAMNPVKRGRKASTVSNASKSSNKEPVCTKDLDENSAESPRTRRSRQD